MQSAFAIVPCAATLLGACGTKNPAVDAQGQRGARVQKPSAIGDHAPRIALRGIDGAPVTLTPGRVTLVLFWATWSAPDVRELAKIEQMYATFDRADFSVIALSVDEDASKLQALASGRGLHSPSAWDEGHRLHETYAPAAELRTYTLDRAGVIRFVHPGYHDGEDLTIAAEIRPLVGTR